ncbi:MAG: 4-(cytidine 5'-diphospho)-2-C-methyl-D-erythritol kinase [Candidatus Omnitrophica bacterium]|nr:4-(cytidine 5'-diphospho)-2-C-methyl-D-erythritol kinase [Candidatus Omnitrophota bacterium]
MLKRLAPAKINLFLEVESKRKDGYHNITTLFLKVGLYDRLFFKKTDKGITLKCRHSLIPDDPRKNLVYQAASLMREGLSKEKGIEIHLEKNIPVGAGLGGGSSDAAATLLALNDIWGLKLSTKELFSLGKKLGADVPLFLMPDAVVLAKGIGDRLTPQKVRKKFWIVLINPGIFISTKDIYKALPGNLTKTGFDVKLLIHALQNADIDLIGKTLFNRLESVVFKKQKLLAKVKQKVSALGVRAVLMSGSGSVIFGILRKREEAIGIKRELQGICKVMVVKSL